MPAAVVYDNDIQNTYASRTRQRRYFVNICELTPDAQSRGNRPRRGNSAPSRKREESRRQLSDDKRRGRYMSTVDTAEIYYQLLLFFALNELLVNYY